MQEFLEYRVTDFMSRSGVCVGRRTTLGEAERLFERHDFNLLPVVDGNRLIGVLTKLDFLKAFAFAPDRLLPPYSAIMLLRAITYSHAARSAAAGRTTVAIDTPNRPIGRYIRRNA